MSGDEDMSMFFVGVPVGFLAICAIIGAAFDVDWLLELPQLRQMVDEIGRDAVRWTCLLVGAMLFVMSLLVMFGY